MYEMTSKFDRRLVRQYYQITKEGNFKCCILSTIYEEVSTLSLKQWKKVKASLNKTFFSIFLSFDKVCLKYHEEY